MNPTTLTEEQRRNVAINHMGSVIGNFAVSLDTDQEVTTIKDKERDVALSDLMRIKNLEIAERGKLISSMREMISSLEKTRNEGMMKIERLETALRIYLDKHGK